MIGKNILNGDGTYQTGIVLPREGWLSYLFTPVGSRHEKTHTCKEKVQKPPELELAQLALGLAE